MQQINPYETEDSETYIVISFSDTGHEIEDEVVGLANAINTLINKQSEYETFSGGSFNSLISEPFLCHPDGSGLLWSLDLNDWE